MTISTRRVALVATLGAIYYALLWLPGIPCVGVPQIKMEIGAAFAPVIGILIGPGLGALTALIADIIKTLTPPKIVAAPFIFCPAVSAFVAGSLYRGRFLPPMLVLVSILIAAMFTPPFFPITVYWYVYVAAFGDKVIALVLLLVLWAYRREIASAKLRPIRDLLLYTLLFIAIESDKALGCFVFSLPFIYKGVFGIPNVETVRGIFLASPLIYVAEYILTTLLAFAVAFSLLRIVERVPSIRYFLESKG